ncbi:MAG: GAF domain-containing protein [Candidatus Brocadiaceae bacterium]|nr:GAF domain-containing protein [Candidatus Brocadiaceae bacterium]
MERKNSKVTTIDIKRWEPDHVDANNTYFSNRVNEEAIGIALTSVFNFESLFKLIHSLTTSILKVKYASIMVVKDNTLRLKYSNHLPKKLEKECVVKMGEGISGWVALKEENILVTDIETDTRFAKKNNKRYSSKSFVSLPLIVSGRVVGVLNVNDKLNGELFNDTDVRALKVISRYSAIAIRNATLVEKTNKLTIVQQLEKTYYDKSSKFLPVTLKGLRVGPFSKSELFLRNDVNGEENYILYWKGGDRLLINEKREDFIRKNINRLYVPKNGRKQYLRFVEINLEKVVSDKSSHPREKFEVLKEVAVNIVNDLSAMSGEKFSVERSKQWIHYMIEFIRSAGKDNIDLAKVKRHDQYLHEHSIDVAIISLFFAHYLGMNIEELSEFGLGVLLQDIGMRQVDPLILNKSTKLNDKEFDIIKKHTDIGYQIIQETGQVSDETCLLALLHHENYDGSGYPHGLKRDNVSDYVKISRIVDVYAALTSDRPYASAVTSDEAFIVMKEDMKGIFDTELLDKFVGFLKSE